MIGGVHEPGENRRLQAEVELHSGSPPAGRVLLVNQAAEPVRLFRPGNTWGDESLSFELSRDGTTAARLVRRPQVYSRNVPASILVAAGSKQARPFDLGDGSWELCDSDELDWAGTSLIAVYRVPDSPEARTTGAWTGLVRSTPVTLEAGR